MQHPRQIPKGTFDTTKVRVFEHSAGNGATYEDVVMKYHYDIKGQLINAIDPYDRNISVNVYDTAGRMLKTTHIDRGYNFQFPNINYPKATISYL